MSTTDSSWIPEAIVVASPSTVEMVAILGIFTHSLIFLFLFTTGSRWLDTDDSPGELVLAEANLDRAFSVEPSFGESWVGSWRDALLVLFHALLD